VEELDRNFYLAGPQLFFAVYYGSRAPMLGGNYALSEKYFNQARRFNQQQLLLVDLLQAEYLDRQKFDRESFHHRLTDIINSHTHSASDIALINQIARAKARRLLEKEDQWF